MRKVIKIFSTLILIFSILLLCAFSIRIYRVVKTEKNSSIIMISILKLNFNNVIQLEETSYITKSNPSHMKKFLKGKGWKFEEQLGAGYIFKNSDGQNLLIVTRQVFSSRFLIWEIREPQEKL